MILLLDLVVFVYVLVAKLVNLVTLYLRRSLTRRLTRQLFRLMLIMSRSRCCRGVVLTIGTSEAGLVGLMVVTLVHLRLMLALMRVLMLVLLLLVMMLVDCGDGGRGGARGTTAQRPDFVAQNSENGGHDVKVIFYQSYKKRLERSM